MSTANLTRHRRSTGTAKVTLSLPETLISQIDSAADLAGETRSYAVSRLLEQALNQKSNDDG